MKSLVGIGLSLAATASLVASTNGGPNGTNGEPPAARYLDSKVTFKPGQGLMIDGGDEFGVSLVHIIQPSFSYANIDAGVGDRTGFSVRRARQDIRGHAFSRAVKFRIQLEHREAIAAKDLWVDWEFFRNDDTSLSLRIGQQKQRSSLQFNTEGFAQMFTERAAATNTFSNSRSTGALLHGRTLDDEKLGFFAGAFNSDVAAASAAAGEENANNGQNELNFIFGAHFDPHGSIGDPESWTEGDLAHNGEIKSTVGASIYLGNETTAGGGAGPDVETTQVNINAGVKLGNGFSTQGEVFIRSDDVDGGTSADSLGWYAQGSYALPQEEGKPQYAFGVRVSMVDFDDAPNLLSGTGGFGGLSFTPAQGDLLEVNGNFSAFYHGHNLKSQIGLTYQQASPTGGADLDNFGVEYLFTLVL